MALLQILSRNVKHTNTILTCRGSDWQWWFDEITDPFPPPMESWLPEAIQMIQQPDTENPEDDTRILRCTGRNQEALQLLRRGVADGKLAAAWGQAGQPEKALTHAEQAAAACREDVDEEEVEQQKFQRNDEALTISHEAVSIYTQNEGQMWDDFLYTIRKQELGANAFHSLSLWLMTAGELKEAILNAEKATELYRELVTLAPRHLPTLASSLQNLASILWNVGRQEEAITACEEAIGIMRKVVEIEMYFLPALTDALDQLAGYLTEKAGFPLEKIELEGDDKDDIDVKEEWETASEADTLMDEEILPAAATTIISPSDVLTPEHVVSVEIQPTGNLKSSQVANDQLVASTETDVSLPARTTMSGAESSGLKISFEVNLSRMDILWIVVGILSLVGILSMVVIAAVNRLH
ncbi:hypothetical protein B0H13DRAFT_2577860 [Mycena leptocephala]|nr:hypothetical protein B0H13DRAFT_2577860 [Mycena leptocephala]